MRDPKIFPWESRATSRSKAPNTRARQEYSPQSFHAAAILDPPWSTYQAVGDNRQASPHCRLPLASKSTRALLRVPDTEEQREARRIHLATFRQTPRV